jgi:hypothetical protein
LTLTKDPKAKEDEENKHSTRLKESKHKDAFNTCSNKNPKYKVKENHFLKPQNSSRKDKRSMQSCNKSKRSQEYTSKDQFFSQEQKNEKLQKQDLMQHMQSQINEKGSKRKQVKHLESLGINVTKV